MASVARISGLSHLEKRRIDSGILALCLQENIPVWNLFFAGYISLTMKLGASLPAYRNYALEELKEATNNFDASSLIGEGSHGQVHDSEQLN